MNDLTRQSEVVFLSAAQMAAAIRSRQLSAVDLLEAHLHQIERTNSDLNAIVTLNDNAHEQAAAADDALARGAETGPLHGVPVTIKDTFETEGIRTTSSHKPLAQYVPQTDATAVMRLRAAGAIVLGKTNMPELARDSQSNSPLFGRANNPWDLERTPGGSTGGGAAAVAAGLSPLEIGSDLGGSIRVPAHYCGVFGLKPTESMVSGAGHIPELPGEIRHRYHFNAVGPLARTLDDLQLCLRLIAGPDGRSWEVPPVWLSEGQTRAPGALRLAWSDGFGDVPVTQETAEAIAALAAQLADYGCEMVRANPADFVFEKAWETYGELLGIQVGAGLSWSVRRLDSLVGPVLYRDNPLLRGRSRGFGQRLNVYYRALARRDHFRRVLEDFLTGYDGWICPVASTPALPHRRPMRYLMRGGETIEVDGRPVPALAVTNAYTTIFSLTGNPVVVLPCGQSREGLPIGVQLVGRWWRDIELLEVAKTISDLAAPFRRPPGY